MHPAALWDVSRGCYVQTKFRSNHRGTLDLMYIGTAAPRVVSNEKSGQTVLALRRRRIFSRGHSHWAAAVLMA